MLDNLGQQLYSPVVTTRTVARRIEKLGGRWEPGKGSHRLYRCGTCKTVLVYHPGDIAAGTLRSIEKDMEPCFGRGWLTGR